MTRPNRPLHAAPFPGIFHPEDYGPIGTDDDTETWVRTTAAVDAWTASRRAQVPAYTSVSGSFETNDVGKPITISSPRPRWWHPVRRWRRAHRPTVLGRIAFVTSGSSVWLCDRNPMPRIRLWRGWCRR